MRELGSQWRVSHGTVQCYVIRDQPHAMIFFGRAEYDRNQPVLSASLKQQGQAVCDDLNSGRIDEDEARQQLRQIYF